MRILMNILLVILISNLSATAQKLRKVDTVYYLVDTLKTPVNDRMLQTGIDGAFKYYAIKCECLKYDQNPTFIYNRKKTENTSLITEDAFKQINFTTLTQLISLAQQDGGDSFNSRHIAYIIEQDKDGYVKHKVKLLKPQQRITGIDYEVVKRDTVN